jgi:hypothetical protein
MGNSVSNVSNYCGGMKGDASGKTIGSTVTWDEGKKMDYKISERCEALPIGTVVGERPRARR